MASASCVSKHGAAGGDDGRGIVAFGDRWGVAGRGSMGVLCEAVGTQNGNSVIKSWVAHLTAAALMHNILRRIIFNEPHQTVPHQEHTGNLPQSNHGRQSSRSGVRS